MSGLNGKVALVTGGTGGIGSAICVKLAQAGCKVVSTYMDEAQANDWKAKMAAAGFDMALVKCDVSSFDDCKAMGDKLNADFGGVDVLVNNAGITKDGTFRKMGPDQWNAVLDVNLVSVFNVTKQVIDGMLNKGWGRVINISSINGQKGQVGQTNYSAAKAGLIGFTKALALENAKKGITVNVICPGYIDTEMVSAVPQNVLDGIIAGIPVGRLGKGEEIADMVSYLAGERAGFVTGATFTLNGGQYLAA